MLFKIMKVTIFVTQLIILATLAEEKKGLGSLKENGSESVVFQLFTRKNMNDAQILQVGNVSLLEQSNYNKSLPTKVFAHGWVGFPDQGYGSKTEYLLREDCNFISVDWSVLASGDYQAVALINVPIAGAVTGAFVDFLVSQGTPISSFHLIGFSMGAHVVGNAGAAVTSGVVPRITGLDPASNNFPLDSTATRLDVTDANFVDVIHTAVAFINMTGHVDFYPNGGLIQSGCPVPDTDCCNHCRVVDYFTESINSPIGFNALKCSSWENFVNGDCNENSYALMGDPVSVNARGAFYLTTNSESPFAQG